LSELSLLMTLYWSSSRMLKNITLLSQFRPIWFMQYLLDNSTYKFLANRLDKVNDQSLYLRKIKVDPSPPSVNHLLFADDNLVFFKMGREGRKSCLACLRSTVKTGQRINREKSSIFLTKECPPKLLVM
jgi:hypothetical protein